MTRNITKIWLLGPGSGSRAQKCDTNMKIIWIKCENNVNLANHIIFTFFHIIFISFSHFGARNPGPGPGTGPQNVKIIWKYYIKNMKIMWFLNFDIVFTFVHIIFILLSHFSARDSDPGPKSHIFVIFLVTFVSYYFHSELMHPSMNSTTSLSQNSDYRRFYHRFWFSNRPSYTSY